VSGWEGLFHPEKTRLIEFERFAAERRKRRGLGKPETFNFLGFTFICSKTRAGKFQIKRKTRRDRMQAKLKTVQQEMRRRMHQPIPDQGEVAVVRRQRLLQLSRSADQLSDARDLPDRDRQTLATSTYSPQRTDEIAGFSSRVAYAT
jgi:hypothetical protein